MREWLRGNEALIRLVADITLTELALFLTTQLAQYVPALLGTGERPSLPLGIYVLVALIWGGAFLLLSVYVPRNLRAVEEAQGIAVAITLAGLALAGTLFFLYPQVSRWQILTFYLLTLILLIGSRLSLRLIRKLRGVPRYPRRRVLLLGAGRQGQHVGRMIANHGWAGLDLVGFLDDELAPGSEIAGLPILGRIKDLERFVHSLHIDEVVITFSTNEYHHLFDLLHQLRELPARIRLVPDHIKTALFRTTAEEFAGVPMIMLHRPVLTPFERQIKRIFDLVLSTTVLIVTAPIMAIIALAIRLDSPGPIIFKQQRIGENGQEFWMYKFRSMVKDAEHQQAKALRIKKDGEIQHKHPDDPRVTRVGRLIRRTSLDEFPQFFNVFKGEMSLVGPRPELPWLVEQYEPWQWQRFSVPQGITGWWQVNGRSDKPMHLYTEEDLFYIQNYSLLLDIQILWRTVGAVIKSRGAY
jgi:exopolysaccharide biosynthesis polyprenyl glycosylphosphotransferase